MQSNSRREALEVTMRDHANQGLPGPLLPEHARVHFLRARGRFGRSMA